MRRRIAIYFIFSAFMIVGTGFQNPHPQVRKTAPQAALRTIIIDAGHGAHDIGAPGSFSNEKDICLSLALLVGDLLKKEIPELNILYTRTTDVFVELKERANFANRNKGDLFVSIHANSAPAIKKSTFVGYTTQTYRKNGKKLTRKVKKYKTTYLPNPAKGTETYIWGAHKNEEKEVALRENAPMLMEENHLENYSGFDPNSSEFMVLANLKTKQFFKRSASLALHVEEEFRKVGRSSRDVKQRQAGIWVLQATAMPSILVEAGFMSNKEEELYMNSDKGQQEIASCIAAAIKRYKIELESSTHTMEQHSENDPIIINNNK